MERQEPQGEETQQLPVSHYPQYQPPPPYTDRLAAQQLASNTARREALRLDAMIAASRQGTPMGSPGQGQARGSLQGGQTALSAPAPGCRVRRLRGAEPLPPGPVSVLPPQCPGSHPEVA